MKLNTEQELAASHMNGPCLVTACPGSGKTRTVVERTCRLVRAGVRPSSIMCITFTNKAAEEMKERIKKALGEEVAKKIWVSTFHRLGSYIIRKQGQFLGYRPNMTICMPDDQVDLISQVARQLGHELSKPVINKICWQVNDARENLEDDAEMEKRLIKACKAMKTEEPMNDDTFYEVGTEYLKRLHLNNQIDFTGMLSETVRLLEKHPTVLDKLHKFFTHFMVDEFQDTNLAQLRIIELLAKHSRNIMAVGDLDQCVVAGTNITCGDKELPVEEIQSTVLGAAGGGKVREFGVLAKLEKVVENERVVTLKTVSGKTLTVTADHKMFAGYRLEGPELYYVYLMYAEGIGFRIGTSRRYRKHSARGLGFQIRLNQEKGDGLWLLGVYNSEAEARFNEHLFSIRHSIPTWLFHTEGRKSLFSAQQLRQMFRESNSFQNGLTLLNSLGMDFFSPTCLSETSNRKVYFKITKCGDSRHGVLHRWSCVFRNSEHAKLLEREMAVASLSGNRYRVSGTGTWSRVEDAFRKCALIMPIKKTVTALITDRGSLPQIPASAVLPGMAISVLNAGRIGEEEVVSVERGLYSGKVFDLTVDSAHNYVANGICISNCIYGWRGARSENLKEFKDKLYPEATLIKLGKNYRSTPQIIACADKLIRHNGDRIAADFSTDNPDGAPVGCVGHETPEHESMAIARAIRGLVDARKFEKKDIAVFYRINSMSRALEMALLNKGLAHNVIGNFSFFDRKEVKDALSMLKFLINANDGVSFHRVANKPKRNLGDAAIGKIEMYAKTNTVGNIIEACKKIGKYIKSDASQEGAIDLVKSFDVDPKQPAGVVLSTLIRNLKYKDYLKVSCKDDGECEDRCENLDELVRDAARFSAEGKGGVQEYLESVCLMTDADQEKEEDAISLMSLHASKGLEFPVVFMVGVEQGILPSERAVMERDDGIEEERRVCYVGMTRAMKVLSMNWCRKRSSAYAAKGGRVQYKPAEPSQFLVEAGLIKPETVKPKAKVCGRYEECPNYD